MALSRLPTGSLVIRVDAHGGPVYEAKWRHRSRQVKRRIGPAWLTADGDTWTKRKGRVPDGAFDEKRATVRMAELIAEHADAAARKDQREREERERGVRFREVAADWLDWLATVKSARPSTLTDYRSILAEPGARHRRGKGTSKGRIMATFGDLPAASITTRDVSDFLRTLDAIETMTPRTVNKHRQVISAIFNYAMRADTHGLPANPAAATDKRRQPPAARLEFFEPHEVERLAHAAADGRHRAGANGRGGPMNLSPDEVAARVEEDAQLGELFRVLAYTGLRLGEVVALQWGDVDLGADRMVVQRAASAGKEGPTKGWQVRYLPLAAPASAAFRRLRARRDFLQREDYVFVNRLGGRLDPSALRRRYHAAREAAGLRRLKLHGLRHGAGSMIARETDPVFVQHFLGHADLSTTARYMHAKARAGDVKRLNRAFGHVEADGQDADVTS